VGSDESLDLAVGKQLSDAPARHARVIADDGEISCVLLHQRVDEDLRGPAGHEAADHYGRSVPNAGNRFLRCHDLVFHIALSS
jgi:hypothetical protein